jgi:lysozyme
MSDPLQNAPEGPSKGMHPAAKGAAWVTICVACVSGFEGIRTVAYKDPVGIPTICFGATEGVFIGEQKTLEDCKALLMSDLYKHKAYLDNPKCMGMDVMDRLHPKTQASIISLVFNTGPGKKGVKDGPCELKSGNKSTMVRYFIAGKDMEACKQFPDWANPPLPGIIKRRQAEMKLCIEGVQEQLELEKNQ